MRSLRTFGALLKSSTEAWSKDQATTLAAALAYYTTFSLAPLLVIVIGVVGMVFSARQTSGAVFSTLNDFLGPQGAAGVAALVKSASQHPGDGRLATILGAAALLLGASGVFVQLQQSLDLIWKVRPRPRKTLSSFIRQRLLSISMMGAISFLLLVSLLVSAALSAAGRFVSQFLPLAPAIWQLINVAVSLAVTTFLFAAIYKVLPDVRLSWRDVWPGALLTAVLFTVGKTLIGLYLGRSGMASSYGAAGSFVLVLLWLYYSSLIFYFGAEFTRCDVLRRRRDVECKPIAEPLKGSWAA